MKVHDPVPSPKIVKTKYYNPAIETVINVNSIKLLDIDSKVIKQYPSIICFAPIIHYVIPSNTEIILMHRQITAFPYEEKEIERWITDLNEIDFPCTFIGRNDTDYNFQINIRDYQFKAHLFATLMLIRALYERGICKIPEIYFEMMDKNPEADKFDTIQTAHKQVKTGYAWDGKGQCANAGHMITHEGNGKNVTKEILFGKYAKSKQKSLEERPYDTYSPYAQKDKWNGDRL